MPFAINCGLGQISECLLANPVLRGCEMERRESYTLRGPHTQAVNREAPGSRIGNHSSVLVVGGSMSYRAATVDMIFE
jgi:hypothetical protein